MWIFWPTHMLISLCCTKSKLSKVIFEKFSKVWLVSCLALRWINYFLIAYNFWIIKLKLENVLSKSWKMGCITKAMEIKSEHIQLSLLTRLCIYYNGLSLHIESIFLSLCHNTLFLGPTPGSLEREYSQLCLWYSMQCQGSIPGWPVEKKVPYHYTISSALNTESYPDFKVTLKHCD